MNNKNNKHVIARNEMTKQSRTTQDANLDWLATPNPAGFVAALLAMTNKTNVRAKHFLPQRINKT
jgi:hypothetical protein